MTSRARSRKHTGSMVLALITICLLCFGCDQLTGVFRAPDRPNVILIVTDDLDARLLDEHPSDYPNLHKLEAEGTTFENAFVTDSLCCPSRATMLRGQYPHNHHILGNWWPQGGSRKFRSTGEEGSTVATWLQDGGYRTVLLGKYMNGYNGTRVPPGWDDWYAVSGDYTSTKLNENGHIVDYDPGQYHLDDVLAQKATGYVRRAASDDPPFFMWLGTTAPHAPATPAPRYAEAFPDASMPRPPSFDEEDVSDKPAWIRDNPPLSQEQISYAEDLYRKRLQSMLSVDDMVGEIVDALKQSGELDNTYIFFTSDNGWHAGQHRLTTGKWTAYEEDIRVPLIVRGPGVPEGQKLEQIVLNNDLAPTFAELGGVEAPSFEDGRSLVPLLGDDPPPPDDWRKAFLVEAGTEVGWAKPLSGDPLPENRQHAARKDWGHPRLEAVRTEDHIYVEYGTGEREFYDLKTDPYQLDNRYESADPNLIRRAEERLEALRACAGATCRTAEDGD
jgi:N-acetylglucosamine-6-sulfatase